MLPEALPRARIMTWGYNADVHAFRGDTSSNNIMEHAHTLIAQLQADREVCATNGFCHWIPSSLILHVCVQPAYEEVI